MKMTKEQVAELLLKANEHFSNVEEYIYVGDKKQWRDNRTWNIESILYNISKNDSIYRIKDNTVKEVTPALLGAKCKFRTADYYAIIIAVDTTNERIYLPHDNEMGSTQFNNDWQLVED